MEEDRGGGYEEGGVGDVIEGVGVGDKKRIGELGRERRGIEGICG